MTDDREDPRLDRALHILTLKLRTLIGRTMNGGMLNAVDELLRDEVRHCKWTGLPMPDLTAFVVNPGGAGWYVEIYRRDLELKAVQQVIMNATVKFPQITPREIALAVQHAWPQYNKGVVNPEARGPKPKITTVE